MEGLRIVRLDVENVKRIEAVTIEPSGSVVIVGGRNAQGKSSVLDSIVYALAGGRSIPAEPLRRGADKGKVVLDLGPITVTRTFTAAGGGSLRIETTDGMSPRSPQAWLDERIAALSFDPLDFARDHGRQAEMLREIVGVDLSGLDAQLVALLEERKSIKRAEKTVRGHVDSMPYHQGVPAEPVSAAELLAELDAAQALHRAADEELADIERQLGEAGDIGDSAEGVLSFAVGCDEEIEQLRKSTADRIAELEAEAIEHRAESKRLVSKAYKLQKTSDKRRAAAAKMPRPDLDEIRSRIASADEVNQKVADNRRRIEADEELQSVSADVTAKTRAIRAARKSRTEQLAACTFPVDGLSFDELGGVTFDGVPFEQVAQSERLRVAVGVALATHSELPIALIRDGSLLDEDALAMVATMAEEAGSQVWIERVGDGDEGAVIIEDGTIRPEAD